MSRPSLRQSIHRLWLNLSKRRRRQFLLVALLMLVGAFVDVVSLGAVFPFIGVLTAPAIVFSMPMVKDVAGTLGITRADQLVLPLTLIFIGSSLLAGAFRLLVLWVNNHLTYAVGHDLSARVYQATLYQPYHVHLNRNSSEIISGVNKVDSAGATLFQILTMANATLVSLAVIVTLVAMKPLISILTLLGFGLCYASVAWVIRGRLYKNSQCMALEKIRLIKVVMEGLGGIREVLLNGNQPFYVDVYRRSDWSLRHAQAMNAFLGGCPRCVLEALGMILICILAYMLSLQSGSLVQGLPLLGAMALGAQRLLPALQQIYGAWAGILGSQADLYDALALIEQPLPQEALLAPPAPLDFQDEIKFEGVFFRYTQDGPWVLHDLNLRVFKGARVGFVGSTGCGKSTTLDLLMGLLLPTAGRIVVDGVPLNGESLRAWQRNIAHVPQSIFLADATMAENIAFGESPEAIDMERVRQVARQAHIAEFIESNPEGYNVLVGERGIRLSGGQRQRLGIARALYHEPEILIFDEATSSLDGETEREISQAIEMLSGRKTLIIIAHRLSTIQKCNCIYYIEKGTIADSGTFEELVSNNYKFKRMAESGKLEI
jgi:ATP-binding cassette subfamily B protein